MGDFLPPVVIRILGDNLGLHVAIADSEAGMASFGTKAEGMAATMGKVGAGVVAAGAGIAIASIKMAGDFQANMTKLVTSAGEVPKVLQDVVEPGIQKLAVETATSTKQLSDGMYIVESAGFHGAQGLQVLSAAAEGARAEQTDLKEVADAVTSALRDYGKGSDQAALYTSKLVAAVGAGKANFGEFTGALHSVLPVASAAKISLDDILGAMASMTVHGMSAEQSAQNLAHTIGHLQTVTAPQAKELALLGINARQLSDDLSTKGLTGAVQEVAAAIQSKMGAESTHVILDLQTALAKLSPQVQELGRQALDGSITWGDYTKATKNLGVEQAGQAASFAALAKSTHGIGSAQKDGATIMQTYSQALKAAIGDSTGLNVALMLTGENAKYTNNAVKQVSGSTTEAGNHVKGWAEITKTFNFQIAKLREEVEVLGIKIGTVLIPPVQATIGFFSQHTTVAAALAAVIGTVLTAAVTVFAVTTTTKAVTATGALVKSMKDGVVAVKDFAAGFSNISSALSEGSSDAAKFGASIRGSIVVLARWASLIKESAVAEKVMAAAQWLLNAAVDAFPIFLIIAAIAALVAGLIYAYNHFTWFRNLVNEVAHYIAEAWRWAVGEIVGLWHRLVSAAAPVWNQVSGVIRSALGAVLGWVHQQLNTLREFWKQHGDQIKTIAHAAWLAVYAAVVVPVKGIASAVHAVLNAIRDFWRAHGEQIKAIVQAYLQTILAVVRVMWGFISSTVMFALRAIRDNVLTVVRIIGDVWTFAWGLIRDQVVLVWHFISNTISTALHIIMDIISVVLDLITGHWHQAWEDLKKLVSDALHGIIKIIMDLTSDFGHLLVDAGRNLIHGLWDGIKSMGSWLESMIMNFIKSFVPGPVLKILGIHSPSTVFHEIGLNVVQGLAQGMVQNTQMVSAAANQLAGAVRFGQVGTPAINAGGSLLAGPVGVGAGSGVTVVNNYYAVNVAGNAVTEKQLVDVIRTQILQYQGRNLSNGLAFR